MTPIGKNCQCAFGAAVGLGAAALLLAAGPAAGQGRTGPGPALDVVETFHPASGERTYRLQAPLSAEERRAVEHALAGVGYRPGPSDGRFTAATERALTRFQKDQKLRACGCVTYETVRRLGLATRTTMTTVAGERRSSPSERSVDVVYPTASKSRPEPQTADSTRQVPPPDTVVIREAVGPRGASRWHAGGLGFAVPRDLETLYGGRATGSQRGSAPGVSGRVPRLLPFVRPVIPPDGKR